MWNAHKHKPIITSHIQLHCLLSRDFPPLILNYPQLNLLHALGGLLKPNVSGEARETQTPTVTFPAGVAVGQCLFRQKRVIYTLIFCDIFLFYIFFSHPIFKEMLPPLKYPWYIYIYICHDNSRRDWHGNVHDNVNVFGLARIDLLLRQSMDRDLLLPIHPQTFCCEHVRYTAAATNITYMK